MQVGISVIIPVYNVEKYLKDCLDSVFNQDFEDYEVICVDDGSTDNSLWILNEYAAISDKFHVIHQENGGLSNARNTGVTYSNGKYVCFLDGDDLLTQNALKKMWEIVNNEDIEILTYELHSLCYENEYLQKCKNKDAYYHIDNEYNGIKSGREFFVEMMEMNDFIESACIMLISTEWLKEKEIHFVPNALFEDSIYALECYFQCKKMKHIKDGFYIYRVRENSIMTETYTYKHLYYRIWQYSECLRMIYTYAKNEREISALALFAEKSLANIKYINRTLEESEAKKIYQLDGLYALLTKSIGISQLSTNYNSELKIIGLLSELQSYSKVLIYGAGVVGNKIKNYMYINGLSNKIWGFAVSQKNNISYIDGLSVKCISDYEVLDEVLLIIAAQENYHGDMLDQAEKCGYQNIRMIDYELECMLDKKLNR